MRRFGTIGGMAQHRVRLTDQDIDLIVAALRARRAGLSGVSREECEWLALRLAEMRPGNPRWILWEDAQQDRPLPYNESALGLAPAKGIGQTAESDRS